jgi:hypothetical protein
LLTSFLSNHFVRDAAISGDKKMYPALSQAEIEEWLEHIPVFAVTDSQGSGVVLKPDNDTSVFYFFMNPMQANATLQQLKGANPDMDLKVSAFSLGKIWFNLLQSGANKEVTVSLVSPIVLCLNRSCAFLCQTGMSPLSHYDFMK